MDDKFILMGLGDENSKDIAEIMKSKTAKKIIDYLADRKEASEKEIADNLGMPLNTAEYNLNKLVKAGLVKKSDKIYWSEKGKRIDMYQMTRKHIIISSDSKPSLSYLKSILPFIAVFAVLLAVIIGLSLNKNIFERINNGENGETLAGIGNNVQGLKSFSSYDELKEFLKKNADEGRDYGLYERGMAVSGIAPSTTVAKASFAESTGSVGSGANEVAGDYSRTNVQVEGVDEPDIVKNDEKYIYIVSGNYGDNRVVIVNAFPANEMWIVSEIDLNRTISQIFVNGDKLIIFSQDQEEIKIDDGGIEAQGSGGDSAASNKIAAVGVGRFAPDYMPPRYNREKTHIDVYDVSDREDPQLEDSYSVSGSYRDARMIEDYVYLISNEYANYNYPMPMYEVNGIKAEMPIRRIYYFDYAGSYTFTSVSALNLGNGNFETEVYLMDNSGSLYVSENNIYLTYQKYIDYRTRYEMMINEGLIPVMPENKDKKDDVDRIVNSDKSVYEKYEALYKIAIDYSNSLRGEEKSNFDKRLRDSLRNLEEKINKEYMRTVINKISIDKEDISYQGKGEVYGTVLNQFSMDEYNGNFRIATTVGNVWDGKSENNIYVLDEELKVIGKLEDLGKGETIHSARFIGNRAYLVTFKKIDPFFVIDLSDAENPKVLGYLKIPGFSDYLHPYDENHIIGIGKDTAEPTDDESNGRDFAWYQGLKISLFDVSDVENPREQAKIVIGDRGTDSNALYDHKAFLFNKEKGVLVLPVRLAKINEQTYLQQYEKVPSWAYGEIVWQGAYVLDIDEKEIKVRGKVTHYNVESKKYYNWGYEVERSLYIDDALYTISKAKIKASDLNTVEDINEIKLLFKEDNYGGILY